MLEHRLRNGTSRLWSGRLTLGWLALGVLLVAQALGAESLTAQSGRISGQVLEGGTGVPLSEVQVFLPGSGVGALTRQNGRFLILNVAPGTHEVRAERIGLSDATQQVTVGVNGVVEINFTMTAQALGLDEIVVTGAAGAARRREIGNTIAQINPETLPDRPLRVSTMLQAGAPGIDVMAAGGEVGQGVRIQLRGQRSLSMTNQPIIYIDGVRMSTHFPKSHSPENTSRGANLTSSPLDHLNPNDIERVEVIKGAAATTLYGTEASAGVIQVFTKRGTSSAPIWTMETQQGTQWSRKFGVEPVPYNWMEPWLRKGWFGLGDGDWGTVHNQQYSASVRGGGQALQYYVSGETSTEVGLQPNDKGEKWVVRGNFTLSPLRGLMVALNTGYSNYWVSSTPTSNNSNGLTLNVFRQDANYFGTGDFDLVSQVLDFDIQQLNERFTSGATITYSPLLNLTNRLTIGYDLSQQEARQVRPFGFPMFPQGGITNDVWQKRYLTFDYVGTYGISITDALRSNVSWGGQAIGDDERRTIASGEGFPGARWPTVNSAAIDMGFEERSKVWNAGFFFQNVFDLNNRYFLTLGARVDGHSAFGSNFGLQVYPKASGSWIISEEGWWPERIGDLKLRAAYGQSGRAPGAFDAVRTWNPLAYAGAPAFAPRNIGNPDLGPEVTSEFETGFEASLLDHRLKPQVTYYRQITSDALLPVTQTPSLGFTSSQIVNLGKLRSSGLEVGVEASPIRRPNWGWDMVLNVSLNDSEILDLGGLPPTATRQEGRPLRVMSTFLVTNPDEIAAPQFESNHYYGSAQPTHIISGNTTVRLPGGVSLSALGEYRGGFYLNQQVFSISRSVRSPLCFPYYAAATGVSLKADTPALWRARCTPALGRGYVFKGDYFKLRSVSAQLPVDFAFPDRITNAVLTIMLDNSYLWMREMPFMDPEMLGDDGANTDNLGFAERMPNGIHLRVALRITF